MSEKKLKLGVYELTGCAGDALLILDCEKELVDIFNAVDIQSFSMATSENIDGELDIALVEGSVTTEKEAEEIKDIRERSEIVVAIGICATLGGIQARFLDPEEWEENFKSVYGDVDFECKAVQSKPIDAYVKVDAYLPGCPISKEQFLELFTRAVKGNPPEYWPRPVCVTCKYRGNDCLLNRDIPCLGPLTEDGCGCICPSYNVPCFGCWGPVKGANLTSEYHLLQEKGFDTDAIKKRMANYSGTKLADFFEQFKKESK